MVIGTGIPEHGVYCVGDARHCAECAYQETKRRAAIEVAATIDRAMKRWPAIVTIEHYDAPALRATQDAYRAELGRLARYRERVGESRARIAFGDDGPRPWRIEIVLVGGE